MTPYAQYKAWWMRWTHSTGWEDKDKAWEEHINELTLFELMETLELYERKDT
jgi:hypothetical protein